ncbi:MAG: hypothetical protein U0Y68_22415 [Blastocatellia bacterium]
MLPKPESNGNVISKLVTLAWQEKNRITRNKPQPDFRERAHADKGKGMAGNWH